MNEIEKERKCRAKEMNLESDSETDMGLRESFASPIEDDCEES